VPGKVFRDAAAEVEAFAGRVQVEVGAAQPGLVGELEGCQGGVGDGGQDVVGQRRVTGHDGAVQVGADDTVGRDALGAAAGAVAGAVAGAGAGPEGADAEAVFEPGEPPDPGDRTAGGDLADNAAPTGGGGDVQDAEPGMVPAGAVLCVPSICRPAYTARIWALLSSA